MKRQLYIGALTTFLIIITAGLAHAQQRGDDSNQQSKNAEAVGTIGETEVRVTYGAPSVKGRTVFGGLEPFGKVWRAGANEATTVTFSTDVKIEGEDLAAGTYGYFILPQEEGEWEVIFNNEPIQWGAFDYDDSKDALRVSVEPEEAEHQEVLSYTVEEGETEGAIVLNWATTQVEVTVTPN